MINEKYQPGQAIRRLTLLNKSRSQWRCKCSCGDEHVFVEENDLGWKVSCGCIVIMGLDLATRSGWSVRNSHQHRSKIECGTFTVKDYDWEEKYPIAANLFYRLVKEHQPDFVAIERPEHGVRQFKKKGKADLTGQEETVSTINPAALQLTGIAGAVTAICMMMNIPFGTIAATSWRPVYYGKGIKPAEGQDWKDLAIEACEREKIKLPSTKAEQRDAAEAVGICTCWHKSQIPNIDWMQKRFMDLRTGAAEQKRRVA
jgi:Holliday junction resolvasome RuvABC endonuclease subunit